MTPSAKPAPPASPPLCALAAGLALASAACGDPAGPPPGGEPEIVAIGRLERGLPLLLRVVEPPGDTVPPVSVAWSVEPAGAGTWSADTLRLERAGPIQIEAAYAGRELTLELDVAAPPEILFDMVVEGNRDLYRAALDGQDLERLTTHASEDFDPTVAGGVVVFVSDRDGNGELYSLPLAGGAEQRLTKTGVPEKHPALSPDGARLAFARGFGLSRVYVANADASDAARPDPHHGHDGTLEVAPAWSPDGATLAFVSTAGGNPDLYLWSGGAATHIEGTDGGEFEPAWSPDGERIAFASDRAGAEPGAPDGDVELYVLDVASGAVTRLTTRAGSDGYPAWLADGRIVYVAYDGSTPALRWLDPAAPDATHAIPLPGPARNPVALPAPQPAAQGAAAMPDRP